jgi:hypothetical protein
MKIPTNPTWAQLIALVALSSTGGGLVGQRVATAEPATLTRPAVTRSHDDTPLIDTLNKLQTSVERLNVTVQELSTKVAVLEDRGRRSGR